MDLPNMANSISREDQRSGICGATLPYSRSCQKSYMRTKLPKNSATLSGTLHKPSSQVNLTHFFLLIFYYYIFIYFFRVNQTFKITVLH